MNIEEQVNDGLKREFKVTVPAADLDSKLNKILMDFRATANIKGFRPGKAPLSLLKQMHGERARGQVISEVIEESSRKVIEERELRPAMQPQLDLVEAPTEGADLEYVLKMEVLPAIDISDFQAPALERLVCTVEDAQIDAAAERIAEQQKAFKPAAKTAKAKSGDAVLIDYIGRVDGEAFDGGTAEDFELELGSGTFIPGFEDQLVGVKAGDELKVEVSFPDPYHAETLAGKRAVFDVTVKEVRRPAKPEVNEEFAKSLGFDDLAGLREALKGQIEGEQRSMSRAVLKRQLLDKLAERYDFAVPETMAEMEYRQIQEQIKREQIAAGNASPEDVDGQDIADDTPEAEEFKAIAERRVRLGLLLSELGSANTVQVSQEDVNRLIIQEAQRYPGQEQQVFEFYQQNEQARAQLRAPLFEEKVVDFIVEMAEVTEKQVSRDALEAAIAALEDEEATAAETAEKPTKEKKKPAAKKAAPKKAADKKPASAKTSRKKATKDSDTNTSEA